MVRVAAVARRGRRITFQDIRAGEVFGEHSAIDGRARFADVVALRESLLASMSPETFRASLPSTLAYVSSCCVVSRAPRARRSPARPRRSPVQQRIWVELVRLARHASVD
jgi:CRP-like cAMP-binding protein